MAVTGTVLLASGGRGAAEADHPIPTAASRVIEQLAQEPSFDRRGAAILWASAKIGDGLHHPSERACNPIPGSGLLRCLTVVPAKAPPGLTPTDRRSVARGQGFQSLASLFMPVQARGRLLAPRPPPPVARRRSRRRRPPKETFAAQSPAPAKAGGWPVRFPVNASPRPRGSFDA